MKTLIHIPANYRPRTKYEGRYCFHRCLSVHTCGRGGEYPIQGQDGKGGSPFPCLDWGVPNPRSGQGVTPGYPHAGRVPCQDGGEYPGVPPSRSGPRSGQVGTMGYPHSTQDKGGYPLCPWPDGGTPLVGRQSGIASTCFVAGGMPLAFRQEDFLVSVLKAEAVVKSGKYELLTLVHHRKDVKCVNLKEHGLRKYCKKLVEWNLWVHCIRKIKAQYTIK